jgi:hypothetical protein
MRAVRCVLVSLGVAVVSLPLAARAAETAPVTAGGAAASTETQPATLPTRAPTETVPPPPAPAPASAPVSGDPATGAPATTPRSAAVKHFAPLATSTMSHFLQFGIALLPGTGYRGIFPYQEMINCGQPGKRVCTGRLPFFLDVQPSFGFAKHWDVLLDLRFGLGQDFTQSHEFALAPGVRYWVDPEEHAKFFATIQAAYDTTAQHNSQLRNNDFALRNSNGFMYEFMRNFGAYVQFGETIGFVRWLRFEIDGGVGVQARLP